MHTHLIAIQQIGYRPLVASPQLLRKADTLEMISYLHPLPVHLDPVLVEAEAAVRYAEVRYLGEQGFYTRQQRTSGRFLDPAAIDRRREITKRTDDFLSGNAFVTSLPRSRRGYQLRCGRPEFYIDDRKFIGDDLDQAIDPEEVLAIEIYDLIQASQREDVFYGRCAIVVWTRASAEKEALER